MTRKVKRLAEDKWHKPAPAATCALSRQPPDEGGRGEGAGRARGSGGAQGVYRSISRAANYRSPLFSGKKSKKSIKKGVMNTGVNNPGQWRVGKKTINTTWQRWTRQLLSTHIHPHRKYYNRATFMHAHKYACVQTYIIFFGVSGTVIIFIMN